MKPIDLVELKKQHLERMSNQNGIEGEQLLIASMEGWLPRPKGNELKNLLSALKHREIVIKGSSFDALYVEPSIPLDLNDPESIRLALPHITFIEIKTANQERVKDDFTGFFFAITENEIRAAELLGDRHKVALFNKKTSKTTITSIPELIDRSKSRTWQVSIQL